MTQQTPLRLPDTMTRDDIGPYMKGVREYFALSQQDVSERLHIRHRYIQAIETGQLDQMPGKAYAKGYVHTYAEFLGLDADQVVEISFGAEPVREQQAHFVPATARQKKRAGNPAAWRSLAILGVVGGVFLLGVVQFFSASDDAPPAAPAVTEVPEEMLSEMRTLVMPTAQNFDCLGDESYLGCLIDSRPWQEMNALLQPPSTLANTDFSSPDALKEEEAAPAAQDAKAAVSDEADGDEGEVEAAPPPPPAKAKPPETRPKETPKPKAKPEAKPKAKEAAKPKPAPAKETRPAKPAPAPTPAPKTEAPAAKPAPAADNEPDPREE